MWGAGTGGGVRASGATLALPGRVGNGGGACCALDADLAGAPRPPVLAAGTGNGAPKGLPENLSPANGPEEFWYC